MHPIVYESRDGYHQPSDRSSRFTDEQLAVAAQAGDQNATDQLVRRHYRLAIRQTHGLFLLGGDRDDLRQEALLALTIAIRDFKPEKGTPFTAFASLVVRRRVVVAVAKDNRKCRLILTDSVRVAADDDGQASAIVELLPGRDPGPDVQVEQREEIARLARGLQSLSPRERDAVAARAAGRSYTDGGVKDKRFDNALQRARIKLERAA